MLKKVVLLKRKFITIPHYRVFVIVAHSFEAGVSKTYKILKCHSPFSNSIVIQGLYTERRADNTDFIVESVKIKNKIIIQISHP